ncbi:uncharacterized protein LOC108141175 [Drosophila elegans]|uniref:uncharacterized protein LOC108141175 n=1 Tax=Drosophila elegans TaxID=30023 RepID=UPI0007E8A4AA|nr:uncharacterized protein LOC108141175 [Drosophila elegans]
MSISQTAKLTSQSIKYSHRLQKSIKKKGEMPKKVITRRQRKAAESKQKAEQELHQNQSALKPRIVEDDIDEEIRAKIDQLFPFPTAVAASSSNEALETEEVKKMAKKTSGRNSKDAIWKTPCLNQADDKPNENVQLCEALQKIRRPGQRKAPVKEVKKCDCKCLDFKQEPTSTSTSTSTSCCDRDSESSSQQSKLASKEAEASSSLVAKFCKQFKSHLHTVLPKRNSATQQEKATGGGPVVTQRNLPLESSNKDLKGDVLKSLEVGPSETSNEPSGLAAEQKLEPPKVFGNTGYFVLTGTNDQLAHQVADLAKKNIVIQSHVCLPSEVIEKAQMQLAELERNREQILEKMRNKHATLAEPPTSRQKEKESNIEWAKYNQAILNILNNK